MLVSVAALGESPNDDTQQPRAAPDNDTQRLTPPKVLGDAPVDYPTGASGDAQVVIELLIGTRGRAEEAKVVTGDEPFASAAVEAAKTWRFQPARRGDTPVRARIRMLVVFEEPEPAPDPDVEIPDLEPPAPGAPGEAAEAGPAPPEPEEPIDVVVTAVRERSAPRLSRAEVRQLPGAFGDPFRAVEILPGVTPIASGLPYYFVRGAPPGNVGYFFDDIAVPALFHVAAGPALIHPAFISDVQLHAGSYPARYGRYSGGIVTGAAAPPRYELHGEASVRLIDAGGLVEAPFAGGRGSITLAGRYSYTAAVVSLLAPEVDVAYWDYQGRVQYRLSPRDTVTLFGFGSYDFLNAALDPGEPREDIYDVTFHRLDLRYERAIDTSSRLMLGTTLGIDDARAGQGIEIAARRVRNRFSFETRLSPRATLRLGGDLDTALYDTRIEPEPLEPSPGGPGGLPAEFNPRPLPGLPPRFVPFRLARDAAQEVFTSRNEVLTGAWIDASFDLGSGVTLIPGFRLDAYVGDGVTTLAPEPRLSARFRVSDRVALLHDIGLAHQAPSFAVPVPGLQGAASQGLQRGLQSSAGAEVDLGHAITGSFKLFQNVLFDATDVVGLYQLQRADTSVEPVADRVTAHSYGFELFLRRSLTKRLGGFISYTLSRSTRSLGSLEGPAAFDRTHVLNLAAAYDFGGGWRAGVRTAFYTGIPAELAYPIAAKSPPRAPAYFRVDWRAEKRWRLGDTGFWALVVEVLNTTLNRETLEYSCYAYGCRQKSIGPVTVPSIGVEAAF